MSSPAFDVLAYSADVRGSHRAELTGVGEPLTGALEDVLRVLRSCFSGTTSWLSLVLVTPTHKNPRITAFLSGWAYERHWMADAVDALLGEPPARSASPARAGDRFAPLVEAVVANVHGSALTAVHMAERAVDGVLVEALLDHAAAIAPSAVATDLLRLRAVLERQQAFFLEAAAELLADSARARRLARRRLTARAWPIAADRFDVAGSFQGMTEAEPGWTAAADARIDRLPGLQGLGIARRSAANPGRPVLRTSLRPMAALGRLSASVIRRKG